MGYKILVINPGSTSTKMAVYEDERPLMELCLRHTAEELAPFRESIDQLEWRYSMILDALRANRIAIGDLSAVVARGGLIKPVPSGVYEVNAQLQYDLRHAERSHVCNIGGLLAARIAAAAGVKGYIADPPVSDEMEEIARITGIPECRRRSFYHALNQHATARKHCARTGMEYAQARLIVVHMGGGISVAVHRDGRVVDVNNAVDGDGPFAPDRAGGIPSCELIKLCYSGKYTCEELLKFVSSKGGLMAHLGTNSVIEVVERVERGDTHAELVLDAMCYNVAKLIGAMATVLSGRVDAILLTGGIAYSAPIVEAIEARCSFIAPIAVYPGENELEALALNVLGVLRGETLPKEYR